MVRLLLICYHRRRERGCRDERLVTSTASSTGAFRRRDELRLEVASTIVCLHGEFTDYFRARVWAERVRDSNHFPCSPIICRLTAKVWSITVVARWREQPVVPLVSHADRGHLLVSQSKHLTLYRW